MTNTVCGMLPGDLLVFLGGVFVCKTTNSVVNAAIRSSRTLPFPCGTKCHHWLKAKPPPRIAL